MELVGVLAQKDTLSFEETDALLEQLEKDTFLIFSDVVSNREFTGDEQAKYFNQIGVISEMLFEIMEKSREYYSQNLEKFQNQLNNLQRKCFVSRILLIIFFPAGISYRKYLADEIKKYGEGVAINDRQMESIEKRNNDLMIELDNCINFNLFRLKESATGATISRSAANFILYESIINGHSIDIKNKSVLDELVNILSQKDSSTCSENIEEKVNAIASEFSYESELDKMNMKLVRKLNNLKQK